MIKALELLKNLLFQLPINDKTVSVGQALNNTGNVDGNFMTDATVNGEVNVVESINPNRVIYGNASSDTQRLSINRWMRNLL